MASSDMPAAVIEQIKGIMSTGAKEMGAVSKWCAIQKILVEHKLAYVMEEVRCTQVLVHPSNRGKLCINAYNCHRIGANIHKVGADLQMLKHATAFEVCLFSPRRRNR
jgi:hypothetical protein